MNGRQGTLANFLRTGINLLRIEQAAVIAQLECMGKKAALCIEQFEGFTGLRHCWMNEIGLRRQRVKVF
jgi:hypothetical protein